MATPDLLEYIHERVIARLVDQVPGTTEEAERAWFDQVIEDWIRAQQPAGEWSACEDLDEAEIEYRAPEGESLHRLTVEFEGAELERIEEAANVPDYDPPPLGKNRDADIVQLWMRMAYDPWPDLPLERAAQVLSGRIGYSVPQPPLTHESVCLGWVHCGADGRSRTRRVSGIGRPPVSHRRVHPPPGGSDPTARAHLVARLVGCLHPRCFRPRRRAGSGQLM